MVVFVSPVFASGINTNSASAPCTNSTLETYSGNTNLQADWQPNTIQIRWYNNNTLMDVQSSANTCVYDGALAVPSTAPTRIGYTFDGWTVRPEMDFSTIPTNENGIERWGKGAEDRCTYGAADSLRSVLCNSDNNFSELQQQEWKIKYQHGVLYGMAGCSTTNGAWAAPGNPTIGSGQYCWCKATGYRATNDTMVKGSMYPLSWVCATRTDSNENCAISCANHCIYQDENYSGFRSALFRRAQ